MKRFRQIITVLVLLFATSPTMMGDSLDWLPVTTQNKPFVRWWWLGSAVDSVGLRYNLEEFARKGLGGVEITPIYGVQDNEANDIPYLSEKWLEMLDLCISEGDRLGLQIDMNNGTGWPFGGPNITPEYASRKLVVETWTPSAGERITDKIRPRDKKQQPVATLQRIIAVDGGNAVDITGKLGKDSILRWEAPKGWSGKVYALFCGHTLQKVKRAAPGGVGLVMNHYDSIAVKHYLDRFDSAFSSGKSRLPHSFFNDSFEVYGADWTDSLLDEFEKDHGYKLELEIARFLDRDDHSGERGELLRDYRSTLARLLEENFTTVWRDWAHGKGVKVRNQAHGSPANIIDLYADVDYPECESFGQTDFTIPGLAKHGPSRHSDAAPEVLKFASSAAHLTGKRFTTAETLTWLTEHFCTSLARCKPEVDQMLAAGVNHMYFHGAPYSPADAKFPDWMFYASINMSPTNSIWRDAGSLFDYIARCQAYLSAGTPDNDFMLYFPIEDVWHEQTDGHYLMFEIHKMQERLPVVKEAVEQIIKGGYECDYLSDKLLQDVTVAAGGRLNAPAGGASYAALIVPRARRMAPSTLRKMLSLASEGATLIFVGGYPSQVPGRSMKEQRQNELSEIISQLPVPGDGTTCHPYGRGALILATDMAEALRLTKGKKEEMRSREGLSVIRRADTDGGHIYFIARIDDKTTDGFVPLGVNACQVAILDPASGRKGLAQTRVNNQGQTEVRLQLCPGESLILKTFTSPVNAEPWQYVESVGTPLPLDKGWSIKFTHSEPQIEGIFNTYSLKPWTELDNDSARVNFGTACYSTTFTLPAEAVADDWILDLGDVRESAQVTVNGRDAGTAWSVPFTIRVGHLLKPGENSLEINVTNLQANRIADFERRGVKWRVFKDANVASVTGAKQFSFADWPLCPAGLCSTVKLIPIRTK